MQTQQYQHEEYQHFCIHHTPNPTSPHYPPDIAAISDNDSSVDSFSHLEMLESEGETCHCHPNVVDDKCDCDSVGPNTVEPDPYPSPQAIASMEDHYHYCESLG